MKKRPGVRQAPARVKTAKDAPVAEVLVVGKEIVTGLRQDANLQSVARYLGGRGFRIAGARVVADDEDAIAAAVRAVRADLLVVTGGLGSTRDDITLVSVARAIGRRVVRDGRMRDRLLAKLAPRRIAWKPRHRAFERRIEGSVPLENPVGLAEGIFVSGRRALVLLPGVPAELEGILATSLGPALDRVWPRSGGSRTVISVAGLRETEIEDACLDLPAFRRGAVSILPSPGVVQLVLEDKTLCDEVCRRLGPAVFSRSGERLEAVVLRLLGEASETVAVAESCTGGLLGAALTGVPGSSRAFRGGIIAYENRVKTRLLGVSGTLLARSGAVSRSVALAMADGVRRRLGADWGVAVTGIAGPGGGSARKPVGLVHIAVSGPRRAFARELRLGGDRGVIRRGAVQAALELLRLELRSAYEND